MLKKNSWILALLLAFSLAAFFIVGCVDPLKVVEDTETYEEYPLDKGYNAWAGQVYQKGWATGGIVFQGKGDALVTAKDLGYDIEMFQKATKLKIEMPDASYPRSGVDIIWGGEDASGDSTKAGGMWNQQPIAGGSGDVDTTYAKKDGNVLIIDLTKALKNYSAYTKAAKLKIVLQVNAPSYGDVEGLVQKAYLMIPSTPPPFKSVGNMELAKDSMYYTTPGFQLDAKITPSSATNQSVVWAIVSWGPTKTNQTLKLPTLDPADDSSVSAYNTAKEALLKKVDFMREEYIVDETVYPSEVGLRRVLDTLVAPDGAASVGFVTVRATIKQGIEEKGRFKDFGISKIIEIKEPPLLTFKVNGTDQSTRTWGAVDNGGVKGGWMDVNTPVGETTYRSYTITLGGGYGNSHHYIEVNLGTETLKDYAGVRCKYEAGDGDSNLIGKTIRVRGSTTIPPRTYSTAGPYVSTLAFPGDADVLAANLNFRFFKDDGNIFKKGEGADMPSPNQEINGEQVPFQPVKDANIVYIWFVPWSTEAKGGKATTFTISDIEFYKP